MTNENSQTSETALSTGTKEPSALHSIRWHLSLSGYIRGQITCESAHGATCRLACAEMCGDETYPCGPEDARHALIDSGECNAVTWIENGDGVESAYIGPPIDSLPAGPITVKWQGDYYGWQYPEVTL